MEVLEGLDRGKDRSGGLGAGAGAGGGDGISGKDKGDEDDGGDGEWMLDRDEMVRARSMLRPSV